MIRLDRTRATLIHGKEPEYPKPSPLPPAELVSMVWDLTVEAYSLAGNFDPHERMRRDIVHFFRKGQYRDPANPEGAVKDKLEAEMLPQKGKTAKE